MKILFLFSLFSFLNAKGFFGHRSEQVSDSNPAPKLELAKPVTLNFMSKLQSKDAIGSLPADQISNTLTAIIGYGTPPQALQVLFDTGSSLFWIRSSACNTQECKNQRAFVASSSSTNVVLPAFQGQDQSLTYGDGTQVSCRVSQDALVIGRLTIPDQKACLATSIVTNTSSTDGIIGLGPPGGSGSVADVFKTLMADNSADSAVVSLWFNLENLSPSRGQAGSITFGGVDSSKIVGSTQWIPLTEDRSFWNLNLRKIADGNGNAIAPIQGNMQVVVDSGTTLSILPQSIAAAVNAKIGATYNPSVNLYTIPCNVNPPPVAFYFSGNGGALTISGSQLFFRDSSTRLCISIIQTKGDSNVPPIFGATFIRNWVTVFDYGQARIGMVARVGSPPLNPSNGVASSKVSCICVLAVLLSIIL